MQFKTIDVPTGYHLYFQDGTEKDDETWQPVCDDVDGAMKCFVTIRALGRETEHMIDNFNKRSENQV